MAILDVLSFPDERLRTVAKPVEEVNDEIKQLVSDMFETMKDENGIGLAATQVNRHVQVVVMEYRKIKTSHAYLLTLKSFVKMAPRLAKKAVYQCRVITRKLSAPKQLP